MGKPFPRGGESQSEGKGVRADGSRRLYAGRRSCCSLKRTGGGEVFGFVGVGLSLQSAAPQPALAPGGEGGGLELVSGGKLRTP